MDSDFERTTSIEEERRKLTEAPAKAAYRVAARKGLPNTITPDEVREEMRHEYDPPVCDGIFPEHFWDARVKLATGVIGFAFEQDEEIVIPFLKAEQEGSGDVGRFLDRLSSRCVIINVLSDRLRGMLVRRGWTATMNGDVDEWRRK